MRSNILVSAVAAMLIFDSTPAFAWGQNGHRIVGKIGEDGLTPQARSVVQSIAGKRSLALLATWPDFIRSFSKWDCVKPWHFLTVEDGQTVEQGMKLQPRVSGGCNKQVFEDLEMPGNVVAGINYFTAILKGDNQKTANFGELLTKSGVEPYGNSIQLTALALVVHMVGDVHQPLHVGRGPDRGGNSISAQWFDDLTNLHTIWDSGLIEKEGLSYTEFADFLEQEFADESPVSFGNGPTTWAEESVSHRGQVYATGDKRNPGVNLPKLSYNYAADQSALVKQRLYRGGKRLAELLNRTFEN